MTLTWFHLSHQRSRLGPDTTQHSPACCHDESSVSSRTPDLSQWSWTRPPENDPPQSGIFSIQCECVGVFFHSPVRAQTCSGGLTCAVFSRPCRPFLHRCWCKHSHRFRPPAYPQWTHEPRMSSLKYMNTQVSSQNSLLLKVSGGTLLPWHKVFLHFRHTWNVWISFYSITK